MAARSEIPQEHVLASTRSGITAREAGRRFGMTERNARHRLEKLVAEGLVEANAEYRKGYTREVTVFRKKVILA